MTKLKTILTGLGLFVAAFLLASVGLRLVSRPAVSQSQTVVEQGPGGRYGSWPTTNVDANGNSAVVFPSGRLKVEQEAKQIFYEDYGTGVLDTTNMWNAPVSGGGGIAAVTTAGQTILGTGTTANGFSYLQIKPSIRPSAPGWIEIFNAVNIAFPAPTNAYLYWGNGTVPGSPTATAAVTNGCGFEVAITGKMSAVCWSGGSRGSVQDLSAATGNSKQPTDSNPHKYIIYFRGDLAYWAIDNTETVVATMSTGALGPLINTLPIVMLAVAGSTPPGVSVALQSNAVFMGDTTGARGNNVCDSTFPFRCNTVLSDGSLVTSPQQSSTTGTVACNSGVSPCTVTNAALTILNANTARKGCFLQAMDIVDLYCKRATSGSSAATATNMDFVLNAGSATKKGGGTYACDSPGGTWTGAINCIASGASAVPSLNVVESQ